MRALTHNCSRVILILVILMTSPLLTSAAQLIRDCREDPTQEQIEAGIKLFDYTAHYTDEHADAAFKRVEDCLRDCPRKQRSLVIKEILLRLQFRELGEDCTSSDEKYKYVLYNGDYITDDSTAYQVWQNELLDTGLIFCTPFKDLICSSITKKCECRLGTVFNGFDRCSTTVGGFCWIPGVVSPERNNFPRLFDAYNNRNYHRDYSVISGGYCFAGDNFFPRGCTSSLKFFMNGICADKEIRDLDRNLDFYFDVPSQRLSFGDSCNLENETRVFTTTEEEIKNYTIRVQKLKGLRDAGAKFCDYNRLFVCGSEEKCECMKPAIYNSETKFCTFKSPHVGCEEGFRFQKMSPSLSGRVSQEIMKGFDDVHKRACPVGCFDVTYPDGTPVQPNSQFCFTCANPGSARVVNLGKNCDKALTSFLEGAPPPALPIDIPDYEKQVELFGQFNEKANEFEGLFRLDVNNTCDYEAELDVIRFIGRIKTVEVPVMIFTTEDYKDLMSVMDKHIIEKKSFCGRSLRGFIQFYPPNNRPFLLCSHTAANPVCYRPSNPDYLEDLMKRLSGKSFQATPANLSCAPHVRDVLNFAEEKFPRSPPNNGKPVPPELSSGAYEYLFNTLESDWLQKVQYCNRTGGFKCSKSVDDRTNATGKCEFSQDLLDEVQAELEQMEADRTDRMSGLNITSNSKSSHKFIQHLLATVLVILHIVFLN